jgi:methionyl-tRNA formyltransferase
MTSSLRLVFLGSDAIALPLLHLLADAGSAVAEVIGVFTQPDRPVGRGQKVQSNAIKSWALGRGLPVFQPEKLTADVRDQLAALSADLALVMAYGHILRDEFISTPRLGTLNLHTSILPKYRGASPIQSAIANGDRETGVTLMRIVRELDAGPVADVERVAIGSLDTALEVEARLANACVPLLQRALPRLAEDSLTFTPQDGAAASYCRKLRKEDGRLDFPAPAEVLAARINGLFPWPACAVEIRGELIKLGLADSASIPRNDFDDVSKFGSAAASSAGEPQHARRAPVPGEVLGAVSEGLLVATGRGVLRLRKLQRPGARMLAAAEFLRGFPVAAGTMLPSQAMTPLVTTRGN